MEQLQYYKSLLEEYIEGNLSSQEEAELWQELVRNADDAEWEGMITAITTSAEKDPNYNKEKWDLVVATILTRDSLNGANPVAELKSVASSLPDTYIDLPASPVHRVHFLKTAWFRYAAVLLLIAGTATFLYLNNQPIKEITLKATTEKPADILPGGNKAILTLADGSTIILDSAANGALANQGETKILKLNSGKLAYQGNNAQGAIGYNVISTPKGGLYQVELPDGSNVWLNAASSIRFPTAFGKERQVIVTGEAYFEVAKNKEKPFIVKTAGGPVTVLGTSFNVNAYSDQPAMKTSLLDGSVKVGVIILKPGQAWSNGKIINTNIQQDVAWKNGVFDFEDVNLEEAMRQLARWYDIEVAYPKGIPRIQFGGMISRRMPLQGLLRALKQSEVYYTIEGRRLTIVP